MFPFQFLNELAVADTVSTANFHDSLSALSGMSPDEIRQTITEFVLSFSIKLIKVLFIWFVGRWVLKRVVKLVVRILQKHIDNDSVRTFVVSIIDVVVMIMLILMIIGVLGIDTSSFIAIFASAGVAIGMALSGTLQNFAGGVMILLFRPFKVGGSGVHSYDRNQPMPYPTRLEAGTLNTHGIAGLSAALDYIGKTGMEKIREKEKTLMQRFYDGVSGKSLVRYGYYGIYRVIPYYKARDYEIGIACLIGNGRYLSGLLFRIEFIRKSVRIITQKAVLLGSVSHLGISWQLDKIFCVYPTGLTVKNRKSVRFVTVEANYRQNGRS